MMFWAWAGVPLGVYNIVSTFSIALQIQPQILSTLSLITWTQCYYYEKHWSIAKTLALTVPVAIAMGGIELGLVFALRHGTERDIHWPVTLMAILAALFLALGVGRHYWDIYQHRTVRGISFIFVGLDAMGDLTSLLSVLFLPRIDVLGLVVYGTELLLWIGVFAAGGYYHLIPWAVSKAHRRRVSAEISIPDGASSTSVFRTPSLELSVRTRTNVTITGQPV